MIQQTSPAFHTTWPEGKLNKHKGNKKILKWQDVVNTITTFPKKTLVLVLEITQLTAKLRQEVTSGHNVAQPTTSLHYFTLGTSGSLGVLHKISCFNAFLTVILLLASLLSKSRKPSSILTSPSSLFLLLNV